MATGLYRANAWASVKVQDHTYGWLMPIGPDRGAKVKGQAAAFHSFRSENRVTQHILTEPCFLRQITMILGSVSVPKPVSLRLALTCLDGGSVHLVSSTK